MMRMVRKRDSSGGWTKVVMVTCYHCQVSLPEEEAVYMPISMSLTNPFRPVCPRCSDEGIKDEPFRKIL